MHATNEPQGTETADLKALAVRLPSNLASRPIRRRGHIALAVGRPEVPVLSTSVIFIDDRRYVVDMGPGEPPVKLASVADPDGAAARIIRMFAVVTPGA